ncbi:MAG: radical SAM protein [Candidatus Woesearchaeota archaeon]
MELPSRILKFRLDDIISLLINPISGAIDTTPTKFFDKIPISEEKRLFDREYFLSESERVKKLENLKQVNKQYSQNVPYWFYVLTTLNCNFSCPICYERKTLNKSETNPETIDKVVETIDRFQEKHTIPNNRINIILFGGEPLCISNPYIINHILESSRQKNWKDVIVTNGSRVKKFIDLFSKYSETISDFRITLDGPQIIHDSRRPYKKGRGSFDNVVDSIDLLLKNHLTVKMQTILGSGNIANFEELISFVKDKGWLQDSYFQWRIEGSHDYVNLDPKKDEISEGNMVQKLIQSWEKYGELDGKIKFESFKYLGHIVRSFGWLGNYKTYWGPKYGFCEPQKGFHYVFSTNGQIYHCPRTINNPNFQVGDTTNDLNSKNEELKNGTILEREKCLPCSINTLCGGGCVVQRKYYSNFDCQKYALSVITEFVDLMKNKILERSNPNKIVSINKLW